MSVENPMKILNFPASRPRRPRVARHLATVETLLSECLQRQLAIREDGRRLQASLARLTVLMRDMVRDASRLRNTLGRLRTFRGRAIPPAARG